MASFRFRAWRNTGTVPAVDRYVDMEVMYNGETNRVSFQVNSAPCPRPADNYAGGWFVLDRGTTILWMNRFTRIDFTKWENEYKSDGKTDWFYCVDFYFDDNEGTTSVEGAYPPQWDEFIALMEVLYPVHGDSEFVWPAGVKYPAEEKKNIEDAIKQLYSGMLAPEVDEEFADYDITNETILPDDWQL